MPSVKIEDLVPEMQKLYHDFEEGMKVAGVGFKVTCTYRPQEEQDALYALGRTKPGKIVTWTKHSRHTEREAFDIVIIKDNKVSWDPKDYKVAGYVGNIVGLEWGGDWNKPDMPHFQLRRA